MTDLLPVIAGVGAALGSLLVAWERNRALHALLRVATAFSEEAVCYIRVKADGSISIGDEQEMGRAAIRFFSELERLGVVWGRNNP